MKTSTFKNLAWLLTLSLAVACNKTTEEIKRVEKVEKVEKVENQLISQQERRNLEMLLENERKCVTTKQTLGSFICLSMNDGINKLIKNHENPKNIIELYGNNEIAAEHKYKDKDKYTTIIGNIIKVNIDEQGNKIIQLETGGAFPVYAYMDKSITDDELINLDRGDTVTLAFCKGDGITLGTPIFKQCYILNKKLTIKLFNSNKIVSSYNGCINELEISATTKKRIPKECSFIIHYYAMSLYVNKQCTGNPSLCLVKVNEIIKTMSSEYKKNSKTDKEVHSVFNNSVSELKTKTGVDYTDLYPKNWQ